MRISNMDAMKAADLATEKQKALIRELCERIQTDPPATLSTMTKGQAVKKIKSLIEEVRHLEEDFMEGMNWWDVLK